MGAGGKLESARHKTVGIVVLRRREHGLVERLDGHGQELGLGDKQLDNRGEPFGPVSDERHREQVQGELAER